MRSRIRRCSKCGSYTLRDTCDRCKEPAVNTFPPRYSPSDRFGKYRRKYYMEGRGLESTED